MHNKVNPNIITSLVTGIEFKTYVLDRYYTSVLSDDERYAVSITFGNEF